MESRFRILFALLLFWEMGFAQQHDSIQYPSRYKTGNELGIMAGISQFGYTWFELGISNLRYHSNGCAFGTDIHGYSLSAEYDPFQKRTGIAAGVWTSMMTLIIVGIDLNTHTDYSGYNVGIKPVIGMGDGWFQIVYGYNFQAVDEHVGGVNRSCFALRFHIPMVNLK